MDEKVWNILNNSTSRVRKSLCICAYATPSKILIQNAMSFDVPLAGLLESKYWLQHLNSEQNLMSANEPNLSFTAEVWSQVSEIPHVYTWKHLDDATK